MKVTRYFLATVPDFSFENIAAWCAVVAWCERLEWGQVSPALRAPGFAGTACPGFRRCAAITRATTPRDGKWRVT